jgi:hypothetical protein
MAVPPLAALEKVEPRTVWSNEAGDYTPWLAQEHNLALLAKTVGIEFEFERSEEFVGPFRADIVCRDANDHKVPIENQLERTDHAHLGQILTHAAGLDAVTVIWVATYFTDEHRAALDWLNRVTHEGINFFGVEIEVWGIANSLLAPNFKLLSQPNEWSKVISENTTRSKGGITETVQWQFAHWTEFRNFLKEGNSALRANSPGAQSHMEFALGRSNFTMSVAMRSTSPKNIKVEMRLWGPVAKTRFHLLQESKADIEREIGTALTWREMPESQSSAIELTNSGMDPLNKEQWPQ